MAECRWYPEPSVALISAFIATSRGENRRPKRRRRRCPRSRPPFG
ncbi:hypothetical protein CRG98_049343 [Punica granatum]|uniref:Uncharacterized protein n=1 Tax=Punica granatum TaxID=22663 RepID=A0A2I0HFY4_PUNGR|nr:hypothetical protein CRG98_049343 [Punica granatum]